MVRQAGFFDVEERLPQLRILGDQFEAYAAAVDFEIFRPDLEAELACSDGPREGRPSYDPVLMFKILVIQTQNNLSDGRTKLLTRRRLLFIRLLGPSLRDQAPDAKTLWMVRERLRSTICSGGLTTPSVQPRTT